MTARVIRGLVLITAMALVVGACGDDDEPATTVATTVTTAAAPVTTAAATCTSGENHTFTNPDTNGDGMVQIAVLSPGDTKDQSFYQSSVDGAIEFAAANGWEDPVVVDRLRFGDAVEATHNVVRQGADLVVFGASELTGAFFEVIEDPDLQCVAFYMNGAQGIPQSPFFFQGNNDDQEASYLAGAYAALRTQRDGESARIAFISGGEFDFAINAGVAVELGAKSVDPNAEVVMVFTGDFDDPALAAEAARAQAAAGSNVLYSYLGGGETAMLEVGDELGVHAVNSGKPRCNEPDISPIAVAFDQPGIWLQGVLPLFRDGEFTHGDSKFYKAGLDYDGVVMCDATPEEEAAIAVIAAQIVDGSLDVGALVQAERGTG